MKHHRVAAPSFAEERSGSGLPDCRTCGACCAFSAEWPRFTLEADEDLALLPEEFVDRTLHRMRCHGDRCSALEGRIGVSSSCRIYDRRPDVCRDCQPGDDACRIARRHFGLREVLLD
jgi:Fe-S-cluster containining protein